MRRSVLPTITSAPAPIHLDDITSASRFPIARETRVGEQDGYHAIGFVYKVSVFDLNGPSASADGGTRSVVPSIGAGACDGEFGNSSHRSGGGHLVGARIDQQSLGIGVWHRDHERRFGTRSQRNGADSTIGVGAKPGGGHGGGKIGVGDPLVLVGGGRGIGRFDHLLVGDSGNILSPDLAVGLQKTDLFATINDQFVGVGHRDLAAVSISPIGPKVCLGVYLGCKTAVKAVLIA